MTRSRISGRNFLALLAAMCVLFVALPTMASAAGLKAELSGSEVKNAKGGDDDGLATLSITSIEATRGKLCFSAEWTRLGTVSGIYVYEGAKGQTGRQVARLIGPVSGNKAEACATGIPAATLTKIEATPGSFFAAIITAEFPAGAVRGQLGGSAGSVAAGGKSVRSNAVPVSGAAVTRVTAAAAIAGSRLTVTLVPGKYPFARQSVSLTGLVSDPSAATLKLSLKATGARRGTGTLTVTGPNNAREPDVLVYALNWTVSGSGNTGTLKLTRKPA
ncbi:MAG: CHRD domain-containing protein [Actinobacteria bacterium]|nr:CHRD domain-containing protein [Actinomycetota bacterium]